MDARFGVLILLIVGETAALYPGLCKPDADNACKDYSSADKCQLTEYCKVNVWSHTLASESKLCQVCKTDIANVQKFISANTTREYVKYDLLALCRACPFSTGRKKCLAIVNDNFDKIYDDIVSKLDPNTICRGLHICRASDDKEDKDDVDMESLGPLWLPGPVQIEDNICFTAEKCSSYNTAVECGTLDLCKEYVWSTPVLTGPICDECKAEIKKIHDWVADNKTEDEVKKELLMFCDRIPIQNLQQKCHNMIATNFDAVYKDIIAFLDANIICSALGLCVPSYEVQAPTSCELDASHACLDYASAAHCNTLNYCQYVVWNAPIEDSKLCKCCLDDIDKLRGYLDSNRTRERVEADFLALCKLLPWQNMKFKCQTTVLHNFERIYQDVINYLNSTVICRAFFLCQNQGQDDALADAFLTVMMKYDSETDSAGCRFCKGQIKALQDWIKSSPTKQSIEKKLHGFCSHIELTAFRVECQSMINEHFDEIYYDLISDTDPDVLCKKLKICVTNSQNEISSKSCTDNDPCSDYDIAKKCGALSKCKSLVWSKHVVKDDDVCRFCEGEIRALQEFVKDNATESEVKQGLNAFCNNMKLSAFKEECLSFMNNNFDDLYADLVALLDPSTVCTYLKLCNQITSKLEGISNDVAASCPDELACNNYKTAIKCGKLEKCKATVWTVPTVEDSNVCTLCKEEIAVLQNWMKSKPVADEVKAALNSFCDAIPLTAFRDECKDNVESGFDEIYADLTNMVDKSVICTGMKLCESISTEKYMDTMMDRLPDLLKKAAKQHKLPIRAPFERTAATSCKRCEAFVDDFQNIVFNNQEIMAAMLKLIKPECESLDGNGAMCDMITYQMTMEHGRQPANTATVCKATNMCSAGDKFTDDMCSNCKAFFKQLQEEMKSNPAIVGEIIHAASEVYCLRKSSELRQQCVKYMTMVFDVMLKAMEHKDVAVICQRVQFCDITHKSKVIVEGMPRLPALAEGEPCADCKAFVSDLQTAIKNNDPIIARLVNLVEGQCRALGELSTLCVDYIKGHYQDVLNQFAALTLDQACDAMRMCPKSQNVVNGDICTDCKAFFGDLQSMIINNRSVVNQDLADLRTAICDEVPSILRGECDKVFDKESGVIITALSSQTPEQTCSDTLFCDNGENQPVSPPSNVESNVKAPGVCAVCEAVMKYVDSYIDYNATEKEIETLLLDACAHLPEYGKQCDDFVKKYVDTIVKLILEEGTSPLVVCKVLGLCAAPSSPKKAPGVCAVCEAVMKYVDSYIDYNATEKEIETLLLDACAHLPEYGKQCDDFVKKYVDTIVKLILEEGTSPLVVCKVLGLCAAPSSPKKIVHGPAECDVCMSVFTEIQHVLADKVVESDIVHELSKICSVIGKYKAECELIINDYGPTILKVLANEVDPSSVCKLIKLCQPSQAAKIAQEHLQEEVDSGVLCEVCTLVADQLDKMLTEKSTQTEIENALEAVCGLLPQEFKDTCDDLVTANFKKIVNFLVKEMNPKVLCVELKLCPAQETEKSGVLCDVCTQVADQLDKMLSDKSTQTEVENALKTVCNFLPTQLKATCDGFVDANFQKIMDILVKEMNPKVICVQLGVCPSQENADAGVLCDVCTQVAAELDRMLSDKATQAEIENALKSVCGILPQQFRTTCDDFIGTNFEKIVAILVKEMNPKVICVQLGVCPAQKNLNSGILCDVCTDVATQLDKMLSDKSTQAEIKNALDTVCSFLPADFKATCDNLINSNFDKIMQMLVDEMNPKVICVQLKVCPAKVKSDPGIVCGVCTLVATELDKTLSDKAVQADIENALNTVCDRLPAGFKTTCDNLIKEYFDEIMTFLGNEMNPKVLCVQLHICPALVAPVDKCEVCKLATGAVDDFLKEPDTSAAFDAALKELCHFLPADAQLTCKGIMDEAGKEIFSVILKEMVPDVFCGDMGFCQKISEKPMAGKVCAICQLIAAELETLLSNNMTKNAIESALKSVCYLVPQKYRSECVSVISQNYDKFMKILLEEMQPKVICGDLKMCPAPKVPNDAECDVCTLAMKYLDDTLAKNATQAEIEEALEKVCSIFPTSYKTECDDMITTYGPLIFQLLIQELKPSEICAKLGLCPASVKHVAPLVSSDMECEVCTLAMKYLDDTLAKNATQVEIETALEKVCSMLPTSYKTECDDMITTYGPLIFQLLIQELKPSEICAKLGLCPASVKHVAPLVSSNVECELCTMVMEYLDHILAENATEVEIAAALERVCYLLPAAYKNECDHFIKQYAQEIIQFLVRGLQPSFICTALDLCTSTTIPVAPQPLKFPGECLVCDLIMKELDKILSEESTEKEILAAVMSVCNIIPGKYKAECDLYIKDYGPGVIAILVQDFAPKQVCARLHMCASTQQMNKPVMKLHVGDEKCSICRAVITELDQFLDDNRTEAAVERALGLICARLPTSLQSECQDFVDEYTPMIFKYIDNIGDPSFVCQHLHLCPTELKESQILGGDKCTYGPSYWCRDMETAKACHAVQHCVDHVW